MNFEIKIDRDAIRDIEDAIDWYETQQVGSGIKFLVLLDEHIERLKSNPFLQVKYKNVRCLPLKSYPYMIHFTVDENSMIVIIRAVFNTHQDPVLWRKRGI